MSQAAPFAVTLKKQVGCVGGVGVGRKKAEVAFAMPAWAVVRYGSVVYANPFFFPPSRDVASRCSGPASMKATHKMMALGR